MAMQVVYIDSPIPNTINQSIMLVGPSPRSSDKRRRQSWRPKALEILEHRGYGGVVFIPEKADGGALGSYDGQIDQEELMLNLADVILVWIPRNKSSFLALTTNEEWGEWKRSGKCVLGTPPIKKTFRVRYQHTYAEKLSVPHVETTLEDTVDLALHHLGEGADRTGGERYIPLMIWRTKVFQKWHAAQQTDNRKLLDARVEWSYRMGEKKEKFFCSVLEVNLLLGNTGLQSKELILIGPEDLTIYLHLSTQTVVTSVYQTK